MALQSGDDQMCKSQMRQSNIEFEDKKGVLFTRFVVRVDNGKLCASNQMLATGPFYAKR